MAIKPTNGRIVNFWPGKLPDNATRIEADPEDATPPNQPFSAIIVYVWSDVLINVLALDHVGLGLACRSVQLLQDGDEPPASGRYATWMDYQKGQAAKTEALQAKLDYLRISGDPTPDAPRMATEGPQDPGEASPATGPAGEP